MTNDMPLNATTSSSLEVEVELKYLLRQPTSMALTNAASSHTISQCYFHPSITEFHVDIANFRICLSKIELHFEASEKQKRTLVAILDQTPNPTIRLRQMDENWYFTVKGLSMDEGTLEFEVGISEGQGLELVAHSYQSLEKVRHLVLEDAYLWEVDVYSGKLDGLVVAELENRNYTAFPPRVLPAWIGLDVTKDSQYKNSCLAALSAVGVEALLMEHTIHP